MFTFIIQFIDLIKLGIVNLFLVFFITSWVIHLTRLYKASKFVAPKIKDPKLNKERLKLFNVLVPVSNENPFIFQQALEALKSCVPTENVIIVANGPHSIQNYKQAISEGFSPLLLDRPSKRLALDLGSKECNNPITFIIDSDTIVNEEAFAAMLEAMEDTNVGGVVSEHRIHYRDDNFVRVVCDWLEDIRFNEVLKGQSGSVGCLCGRMLAVRSMLLREMMPEMVSQKFLGSECISGDDRFLTSWLLKMGFKTVFVPTVVYTDSPNTIGEFVKQRLRWSRTSLRETILSLPWLFKHPFTAFTTLANVVMRWFYFVVLAFAALVWAGVIVRPHYFEFGFWVVLIGTVIGFFVNGFLKQLRHLKSHPKDIKYLPHFLFMTTFILLPVEWFGNLTLRESGWLTRKTY